MEALAKERKQNDTKSEVFETALNDASCEVVSIETKFGLKKAAVEEEKATMKSQQKALYEAKSAYDEKKTLLESQSNKLKNISEDFQKKQTRIRELQDLLNTLTIGVSAQQGHENGYMDQLQAWKKTVSESNTKMEQLKMKLSHRERDVEELAPKERRAAKEQAGLKKSVEEKKRKCEANKKRMAELQAKLTDRDEVERLTEELSASMEELRNDVEDIERAIGHLFFSYKSPGPSFNPDDVLGIVAQLATVKDQFKDCLIALEIAAGGKLYNVVVKTETAAAELLKRGQLTRRFTLVPINKINPKMIKQETLSLAYSLAPEKAELALNVISFDPEVTPAMQFVFGNTLICQDNATAQKLTFDKRILTRSVTVDGDIYDPSGSLSGGAYNGIDFIAKVQKWKKLKTDLAECDAKQRELMKRRREMDVAFGEWDAVRKETELREHEVLLVEKQLATNEHAVIMDKFAKVQTEIREMTEELEKTALAYREACGKVTEVEREMAEFSNNKGAKLKTLQSELAALKAEVNKKSPTVKAKEMELEISRRECGQCEEEIKSIESQIDSCISTIDKLQGEADALKESLTNAKSSQKKAEKDLHDYRKSLMMFDDEFNSLRAEDKEKKRLLQDAETAIQKNQSNMERMKGDYEDARERLAEILGIKDNAWVQDQQETFGVSGGPYDFESCDIGEIRKRSLSTVRAFKNTNCPEPRVLYLLGLSGRVKTATISLNLLLTAGDVPPFNRRPHPHSQRHLTLLHQRQQESTSVMSTQMNAFLNDVSRKRVLADVQLPSPSDNAHHPFSFQMNGADRGLQQHDLMDMDVNRISSERNLKISTESSQTHARSSQYPTPTSPTFPTSHAAPAASEPQGSSITPQSTSNHPTSVSVSRIRMDPRKSSMPTRSLSVVGMSKSEKEATGIVRLDVYKEFMSRPQALLFDREALFESERMEIQDTREGGMASSFRKPSHSKQSSPAGNQLSDSLSNLSGEDGPTSPITTRRRRSSASSRVNPVTSQTATPILKPVTRQSSGDCKTGPERITTPLSSSRAVPYETSVAAKRKKGPKSKFTGPPPTLIAPELMRSYTECEAKDTAYTVTWAKNPPMKMTSAEPGYELLQPDEVYVCNTLRLPPYEYLYIKQILVAARHEKGTYRKREAQSLCNIDVNKTGKVFEWFIAKGWLIEPPPGRNSPGKR
ncbi:Structural maintenance of chromosomes protein 2 [Dinochytrium kinnereticum]|nr:Structural maintenance of chromosomes protein 2 [Dinochytrium kinnereticum]